MTKANIYLCRGYSGIETLGQVSSEQISSRKLSIFDNDNETRIHPVQQAAECMPEPLVQTDSMSTLPNLSNLADHLPCLVWSRPPLLVWA